MIMIMIMGAVKRKVVIVTAHNTATNGLTIKSRIEIQLLLQKKKTSSRHIDNSYEDQRPPTFFFLKLHLKVGGQLNFFWYGTIIIGVLIQLRVFF